MKSAETNFKATVGEVGTCRDLLVMEPTGTIFGALSLTCYTGGCAVPTHAVARLGEPSVIHPLLQVPKSLFGQVSHLIPPPCAGTKLQQAWVSILKFLLVLESSSKRAQ